MEIVVLSIIAGVAALQGLAHAPVRVTMIDDHPDSTFRPPVYQVIWLRQAGAIIGDTQPEPAAIDP